MYRSFLIVDDFFVEPQRLRADALALDYPEVTGPRTFPGRNSDRPLVPQGFDQVASGLLGERVEAHQAPGSYHLHFRITLAGEEGRYHVHVDPSGLAWVGVIYLSLPEHCQGGTSFYRHKALGLDRTPHRPEALQALRVGSIAELLRRDGPDEDAWEHLMTVPMRFNRAIFYRPWLWHSAGPAFGDRPENARLIQLMSFRYPNQGVPPGA